MTYQQAHKNHNPKENKVIVRKEYTKMKNTNKGFTLIELIMVTIILGILAAVAIPRYMATVEKAEEAAEDAVISSVRAGLENYATENLLSGGRRIWPPNPFTALATSPAGYNSGSSILATEDGEWTWDTGVTGVSFAVGGVTYASTGRITHQRGDNTRHVWSYNGGTTGDNAAVGALNSRTAP